MVYELLLIVTWLFGYLGYWMGCCAGGGCYVLYAEFRLEDCCKNTGNFSRYGRFKAHCCKSTGIIQQLAENGRIFEKIMHNCSNPCSRRDGCAK